MGTYGYISIIAMLCYGFMLLMFLTAKRNRIINSFLVVLTGLLFWTGGSAFMRAQLWPGCEFRYQVSLLGILLLPYAYYRFILAFGGEKNGISGRIYLAVMLICFWLNAQFGVFLESPSMVEKTELQLLYMRSSLRSSYFLYQRQYSCSISLQSLYGSVKTIQL